MKPHCYLFLRSARNALLLIGCQLSWAKTVLAQASAGPRPTNFYIEGGSYVVSGSVPFWLRANQSGIAPLAGSTGMVRLGLYKDYHRLTTTDSLTKPKRMDWGYGLEGIGRLGQQATSLLPEAYLKARWGSIELYVGRRRDIAGLVDTLLTSGAYAWSGNALPIPKIQIGTIGYIPLGFTKGFVAVNAFYNHGWFNEGFVKNSYLHQKVLYLRFGKPKSRVKVYAGGNHEVQWGGYAPSLAGVPGLSDNLDGRFASDLSAYFRVVTSSRGTGYAPPQGIISVDQGNRIGNHLGSFDGGLEVRVGGYQLLAYRQNLYETGALYYLTNLVDGLNGLRLQRCKPREGSFSVDHLLVEFFYTQSQGGPEFVIDDPQRRGRNNYFNHSQYQDGWTYMTRTIGTPFLTPQTEVQPNLPVSRAIANNRVSLWHMGLAGRFQQIRWLTKLSYSQNYGTYDIPYPTGTYQFSVLLTLTAPLDIPALGNWQLHTSLALDRKKLLINSSGCYIGLRKVLVGRFGSGNPSR